VAQLTGDRRGYRDETRPQQVQNNAAKPAPFGRAVMPGVMLDMNKVARASEPCGDTAVQQRPDVMRDDGTRMQPAHDAHELHDKAGADPFQFTECR
jgi:hypothetical protein